MTERDYIVKFEQKDQLPATMTRREFSGMCLTALLTIFSVYPANAQRRRQIRRARRRRRIIRRRAIRRFQRRGGRLEERARSAIRHGDIRPLREVMAKVRRRSNAEVLDVDLHKRRRGWVYALRILTLRGRVRDVFLDARTLEVLHIGRRTGTNGVPLPQELNDPLQPSLPPKPRRIPPAQPAPIFPQSPPLPSRRLN